MYLPLLFLLSNPYDIKNLKKEMKSLYHIFLKLQ